ncbi:MAG TPA: peptidoglycan DD-metalloendopeptidase family protein [Gemmatimonadales bacterium]|nr:peptidoglycan DD-metalloendopeptidase family protein [Gemmatimonadales bacterium]
MAPPRRLTYRTGLLGLVSLGCSDEPAGIRVLPVVTIVVTPEAVTLPVGESARLEASVSDLEGRPLATREITWSSSAPDVASVSATGVVTASSPGRATVGAYSEQSVGFAHVVVQLDFRLPVSPASVLRAEIGTPTALCAAGEGGLRQDGRWECSHAGISRYSLDFRADEGQSFAQVGAAADGTVADVCLRPPPEATCGPDGPFVYIEHGFGFASFYSHLDPASISVRRKMSVAQGETVGRMGTWGAETYPWTHFELRYQNQDPAQRAVLDQLLVERRKLTDYRVGE